MEKEKSRLHKSKLPRSGAVQTLLRGSALLKRGARPRHRGQRMPPRKGQRAHATCRQMPAHATGPASCSEKVTFPETRTEQREPSTRALEWTAHALRMNEPPGDKPRSRPLRAPFRRRARDRGCVPMRAAFVWKETQAHLGHQPAHPLPRLLWLQTWGRSCCAPGGFCRPPCPSTGLQWSSH